jgi:hypothetical protein
MAQTNPYELIIVESFLPESTAGLHGPVHIRPIEGQGYPTDLHVECSKSLSRDYPVGTRFRIRAKRTDREGGTPFLYSSWRWNFEVLS